MIKFIWLDIGINLNSKLKRKAKIKFTKGPLAPIQIMSLLGFLKEE
jgi:hypothetical protein